MKNRISNPFRSGISAIISVLTLSCFAAPSAFAITYYWDNDGTTAGFGTASGTWAAPTTGDATQGWSEDATGSTLPVDVTTTTSDTVNFGASSPNGLGSGTVAVSGTVNVNKATFGSASGAITLSGGTVALGGTSPSITLNSTGHTISSALTLDDSTSVVMGTQATVLLNLNSPMGGTGNLTFTTPNTNFNNADQRINLGAASSYTGNTLLNVGNSSNRLQVTLGVDDALPATTVLTFDGGVGSGSGRTLYLDLNGFDQTLAGLTNIVRTARTQRVFSSGGPSTLTVNNADDYSFGGSTTFVFNGTKTTRTQITGEVSLVKTGAGTFTLIEIHPYTGTTLVSGGRLQGVVGGNIASSAVSLEAAGIYGVSVTDNTKSWTCASLTTSGAGALEFDFGSVAPSTTVSPLIVTGAADFTGATPTVNIVTDSALAPGTYPLMTWGSISGSAPTGANLTMPNLPFGFAADLQVAGTTLSLVITSTNATFVKANNADDLNLDSSWEGGAAPVPGDIAKWNNIVTSTNTTVLGADLNWAGLIIENPTGPVTIGGANTLTLGLGPAATEIDLSAATADLTLVCDVALGDANIWNVATGRTLTVGGGVSGNFLLTMQGNGTVRLGAADVLPNGTGNGNLVVDSTLDLNGNSETVNGLSGAGAIDNSSDSTIATLTAGDNDQSGTFAGILQDSGVSATLNFEKTGTGTIELQSANTLSGTVSITGGKLAFSNTNPFDSVSGIEIADGASIEPRVDGGDLTAPINLSGGIGTITFPAIGSTGGAVYTLNLDSQISGAGGLTLFGVQGSNTKGTIVLGAANTYAGDTLIDATIFSEALPINNTNTFVELGVQNAFPATTVLTIDGRNGDGSGRTSQVDLKGFNQTLAGLTNIPRTGRNQRIINSSGTARTLTVDQTADYTFSGNLGFSTTNNFGLTKAGVGTFTISGTNNYSGPTVISGGMLAHTGTAVLTSGNLSLGGGGVLGQGVNFTNALGTAINEVQWIGSGGFAAVGTNMTVTLAGGSVQWNSGNFVPGGEALILSHPNANRKVTFANDINFAGSQRTIQVDNGSAFVDAEMSGTLGIAGGTGGGLTKTGAGTLDLLNTGLYTGLTIVSDGHLRIGNTTALDGTSGITLEGGTRLSPTLDGVVIDAPITLGTTGTSVTINAPTSGTGAQVQTLTLDGPVGGDGNLIFYGSAGSNTVATIMLGAQSNYAGTTLLDTAGSANSGQNLYVEAGIANALPPSTVLTLDGGTGSGSGRTLQYDLKGFDQTLAGLTNVTDLVARNQRLTSSTPATLTVNNSDPYSFGGSVDFEFSGPKTTRARIEGAISILKSGVGTFTLVEAHTYTGDTTVTGGVLSIGGINPSNESSTVTIAESGATLDLTFAGTDTVDKLFIGTTQLAAGEYKAVGSVASGTELAQLTGTGTLTVTTGPLAGGYSSWALLNGAGVELDGDHDADGVSNGIEFFIGGPNGNTTGFTALPGVDNTAGTLSVTWTHAADYAGDYETDFVVEVSGTLGSWVPAPSGITFPDANSVKYTFPAGTKNFARLKVTSN